MAGLMWFQVVSGCFRWFQVVPYFSKYIFPTFLNRGTTVETFQQFGKQLFFRHILKSSASMYESLGSQFFRTAIGIQSG